ncbi:MAG: response regulator [Candidatus Omnitrophica bacterium]|nr:response regulator [Candidatus Omnitrophota bacterium]
MDKAKILIVDDEQEARRSLSSYLSRHLECDTREASDGREALEALKNTSFDLILLDIKMPGISGIDVLKKAKAIYPDIDVLMISAWDAQSVAEEAIKTGALDYITKPSTIDVIYGQICDVLKKRNKFSPKAAK